MSASIPGSMTADDFLLWAEAQPEGQHYELLAGRVIAMAPECAGHGRTKLTAARRLADAIETQNLPCEVYVDRMAVRVDPATVYEPDVLVRCGARLDPDAIEVPDPMIVVEVVAPSSRRLDTGIKLEDYFRIPSVRHYLILKPGSRSIVHHRRDDSGVIATAILPDGPIHLDPPGITIADLFADL